MTTCMNDRFFLKPIPKSIVRLSLYWVVRCVVFLLFLPHQQGQQHREQTFRVGTRVPGFLCGISPARSEAGWNRGTDKTESEFSFQSDNQKTVMAAPVSWLKDTGAAFVFPYDCIYRMMCGLKADVSKESDFLICWVAKIHKNNVEISCKSWMDWNRIVI